MNDELKQKFILALGEPTVTDASFGDDTWQYHGVGNGRVAEIDWKDDDIAFREWTDNGNTYELVFVTRPINVLRVVDIRRWISKP